MSRHADPDTGLLSTSFPLPLDRPFTTAQATAAGVRADDLTALCAAGLLRRVLRGVCVAAQAGDSVRIRAQALGLVVPGDAVVCDRHAAWLSGADMALAPGEHLEVQAISVFRPSGHGRVRWELAEGGERNLLARDVTEVHGVRVTTPLRTALDLGRVRHLDRAIAGMDQVARLGRFSRAQLLGEVDRFRGMRWVTTLRAIAPLVDGRAESPPESVLRLRWIQAGLPTPEPQVEVWEGGRVVARLDVGTPGLMLAAEYDGEAFHSSEDQVAQDLTRRSGLEERHGWLIVVVRRDNLFGHFQDVEILLHRGLVEARRRTGHRIVLPGPGDDVTTGRRYPMTT